MFSTFLKWISKLNSAFAVRFYSIEAIWVKFDSGMIFPDQSQFFAAHSKQCDCFILYRQQITSNGFYHGQRPAFELRQNEMESICHNVMQTNHMFILG